MWKYLLIILLIPSYCLAGEKYSGPFSVIKPYNASRMESGTNIVQYNQSLQDIAELSAISMSYSGKIPPKRSEYIMVSIEGNNLSNIIKTLEQANINARHIGVGHWVRYGKHYVCVVLR